MVKFLHMYDGVHTLLMDRSEIGDFTVPERGVYSRKNPDHVYSDYTPSHFHHNWRFTNFYDETYNQENKGGSYDPSKHTK